MSAVEKNFLDYAGLQAYDGKIKEWSNSVSQAGVKTVLKTTDGNSLKFYKKPNATLSDTADFTIDLGSADAADKLDALATLLGATWVGPAGGADGYYSVTFDASIEATTIVGAINEVISDFNAYIGEIPSGATATTVIGFISEAINNAVDALDGSAAIASVSNNVVTIKTGITETNGVVTNDSGTDIVLEEVAVTGAAADVSVADTAGNFNGTTVETVLAEIADALDDGVDSKTIYLTDDSAGQSDYAKVYNLYQGSDSSDMTNNNLVGTINVPKDKVVQSGSVVSIIFNSTDGKLYDGLTDVTTLIKGTGTATADDAGKYIKLVLQNVTDPLYISVKDLVDVYTAEQNASQVQIVISNTNEISATIVAGSVTSTELASNAVTTVKIADDAVTADKVAISAHSETQTHTGGTTDDGLSITVTTTDGQVSAVSGSIAANTYEPYGAAASAIAELDTASDVAIASYDSTTTAITIQNGISETDGVIAQGAGDGIVIAPISTSNINSLFS